MNSSDYDLYLGDNTSHFAKKVCLILFALFVASLAFTVVTYGKHAAHGTKQAVEREASKYAAAFEDINTIIGE